MRKLALSDEILMKIDKPVRYIGHELNSVVKNPEDGVKILGNGELTKKLNVKVNAVSETAKSKIEAAGGTVEVI